MTFPEGSRENFDDKELTSEEVARLLPASIQQRLGLLWGEDSSIAAVAVSAMRYDDLCLLQEHGIITTGDPELPLAESEIVWTDFGSDVSLSCDLLWLE